MLTLTFHTDPGHGWLEADLALVRRLALNISRFSYMKGNKAYLEEDCDAPQLINALDSEGIKYKIVEKHTDRSHWIRNCYDYSSY